MSMQMDAESKKEQIGTLSVWVGALEGGFGGGGGPRGGSPQKVDMPSNNMKQTPFCSPYIYFTRGMHAKPRCSGVLTINN